MISPFISVIIPAYNYADYAGLAIDSVLAQTYPHFELVVVDDGSTDNTAAVVQSYTDPRLRYLHQANRGLPAARNTGIRASRGEILAFLDADDRFHPAKLAAHVDFLRRHPEAGLSYNARYLTDRAGNLLFLQRVPPRVELLDLVSGYPITPSDVVVRREWAERVGLFDESFVLNSEDLNFHLRLALAGCRFAGLERALGYRQIHTSRQFRDIPGKLATYRRALDTAFDAPNCPPEVRRQREPAYARHYLTWGFQAAAQGEGELGREYFAQAARLDPALLAGDGRSDGRKVAEFFVHAAIRDGGEHAERLQQCFDHLPPEMACVADQRAWVAGRAWLQRGLRDLLWGRAAAGQAHVERAAALGARLDPGLLHMLSDQLSGYAVEFGAAPARAALQGMIPALKKVGTAADVRWLGGYTAINTAYSQFRRGRYLSVPLSVLRAALWDPRHLADRGVIRILARSLVRIGKVGA